MRISDWSSDVCSSDLNQYTAERPVTLRDLLSHRAGVTTHGFSGYAHGEPLPSLLQILDGIPPANSEPIRVDTLPGSRYRYSGGGYEVVQQLVADEARQPFAQVMQEKVLEPIRKDRKIAVKGKSGSVWLKSVG